MRILETIPLRSFQFADSHLDHETTVRGFKSNCDTRPVYFMYYGVAFTINYRRSARLEYEVILDDLLHLIGDCGRWVERFFYGYFSKSVTKYPL